MQPVTSAKFMLKLTREFLKINKFWYMREKLNILEPKVDQITYFLDKKRLNCQAHYDIRYCMILMNS